MWNHGFLSCQTSFWYLFLDARKKKGHNTNFGDVCEKATEALLFLFLENSYNKWVAKAKGEAGGRPCARVKKKEEVVCGLAVINRQG